MNTWKKVPPARRALIMQVHKSKILRSLAVAGRAFVAEDTGGLQDDEDDKRLEEHIHSELSTIEHLTMTGQPEARFIGPVRMDLVTNYDAGDDMSVYSVFEDNGYVGRELLNETVL